MKTNKKKTIKDFLKKYSYLEIEYSHCNEQGSILNRHIDTNGDPHYYYREYSGKILVDEKDAGEVYFTIFDYDRILADGMNALEVADEHSQLAEELFSLLYNEESEELVEPLEEIGGRIMILENMMLKAAYRGYGLEELVEKDILDIYGNKVSCLLLQALPLQIRLNPNAPKSPYKLDKLNPDIPQAQQALNAYFEKRGFQKIETLLNIEPSDEPGCNYIKILDEDFSKLEDEDWSGDGEEYVIKVKNQLEGYIKLDMPKEEEQQVCLKILDLIATGALNDNLQTPDQIRMLLGGGFKEITLWKALSYMTFLGLTSIEYWYEKEEAKFQIYPDAIEEAIRLGIYLHEGREIADTNFGDHIRVYIRKNKNSGL